MMIVRVTADGIEEDFDLARKTTIGRLFKDGYWRLQLADGRTVAINADTVDRLELIDATVPDDTGELAGRRRHGE